MQLYDSKKRLSALYISIFYIFIAVNKRKIKFLRSILKKKGNRTHNMYHKELKMKFNIYYSENFMIH